MRREEAKSKTGWGLDAHHPPAASVARGTALSYQQPCLSSGLASSAPVALRAGIDVCAWDARELVDTARRAETIVVLDGEDVGRAGYMCNEGSMSF